MAEKGRIGPTYDNGTKHDEGNNHLQRGRQELFLVSRRVMWDLQFGESEGRDKYRSDSHLGSQLVNISS